MKTWEVAIRMFVHVEAETSKTAQAKVTELVKQIEFDEDGVLHVSFDDVSVLPYEDE